MIKNLKSFPGGLSAWSVWPKLYRTFLLGRGLFEPFFFGVAEGIHRVGPLRRPNLNRTDTGVGHSGTGRSAWLRSKPVTGAPESGAEGQGSRRCWCQPWLPAGMPGWTWGGGGSQDFTPCTPWKTEKLETWCRSWGCRSTGFQDFRFSHPPATRLLQDDAWSNAPDERQVFGKPDLQCPKIDRRERTESCRFWDKLETIFNPITGFRPSSRTF